MDQSPQFFTLTQPSSAIASNWRVKTGWRPSMVMGFDLANGQWVKLDGRDDSSEHAITYPDGSASAARTNNICQLTDDGFTLGNNSTWIRADDLVIHIAAFPPGYFGMRSVTLSDDIADYVADYGTGKAYDATPQDEKEDEWIYQVS